MTLVARLEALRAIMARGIESAEQAELKGTSAGAVCNLQAVEMAEAANIPFSAQKNSCAGNASRGEIDLLYELDSNPEAAVVKPEDADCLGESAIAARIAELHDRIGGFIKPCAAGVA